MIDLVGLNTGDPIMGLGSGPGLLAIPFARAGMEVTAVDLEPAMLEAAAKAAHDAGVSISCREGSSFLSPFDAAPFRVVSIGRAFH